MHGRHRSIALVPLIVYKQTVAGSLLNDIGEGRKNCWKRSEHSIGPYVSVENKTTDDFATLWNEYR